MPIRAYFFWFRLKCQQSERDETFSNKNMYILKIIDNLSCPMSMLRWVLVTPLMQNIAQKYWTYTLHVCFHTCNLSISETYYICWPIVTGSCKDITHISITLSLSSDVLKPIFTMTPLMQLWAEQTQAFLFSLLENTVAVAKMRMSLSLSSENLVKSHGSQLLSRLS